MAVAVSTLETQTYAFVVTAELLIGENNESQRTLIENAAPPFLPIGEASEIRSLLWVSLMHILRCQR